MELHRIFATLGDPVRFRIVELLTDGERSVTDLVAEVDIHQSGVSRHLATLLELGLVQVRRDGPRRWYSLRNDHFEVIAQWAADSKRLWSDRIDRLEVALTAGKRDRGKQDSNRRKR